ncbi:hypothetical protein FKV23_06970 [Lysobacter alkalisoli]|uniref:ESPR domain-containing protein n=1 Tax=Marilutibacter alkalisoli TaxID=2591633 RepID=A0A514BRC1_9GAMM|nr:hypothetical protein FKV23_06970 [Lysobacter alkalisoli]
MHIDGPTIASGQYRLGCGPYGSHVHIKQGTGMNHVFRVIWSQAQRAWVVVSELASHRGRAGVSTSGGVPPMSCLIVMRSRGRRQRQPGRCAWGFWWFCGAWCMCLRSPRTGGGIPTTPPSVSAAQVSGAPPILSGAPTMTV